MTSDSELQKTVVNLAGAKVLVIGDLMLDTYMVGDAARISPEAPVPVIQLAWVEDRPGGAANTAMNISALGGEPAILGAIGPDDAGHRFMDILTTKDFNVEGIFAHHDISTIRKTRVVAGNQQIVRIDDEESVFANFEGEVLNIEENGHVAVGLVVFGKGNNEEFLPDQLEKLEQRGNDGLEN